MGTKGLAAFHCGNVFRRKPNSGHKGNDGRQDEYQSGVSIDGHLELSFSRLMNHCFHPQQCGRNSSPQEDPIHSHPTDCTRIWMRQINSEGSHSSKKKPYHPWIVPQCKFCFHLCYIQILQNSRDETLREPVIPAVFKPESILSRFGRDLRGTALPQERRLDANELSWRTKKTPFATIRGFIPISDGIRIPDRLLAPWGPPPAPCRSPR